MILLAVATSGDPCSLAIADDRGLLAERTFRHRMCLSERLIGDVDALLQDAGIDIQQVDAYAVDLGPGSFTGVRIGVTAIKTWADVFRKPAIGVNALEAAAHPLLGQHADLVVPVIRARPGAVYAAVYDGFEGKELRAPEMLTGEELGAALAKWRVKRVTLCADGWSRAQDLLGEGVRKSLEIALVKPRPPYASVVAEIASAKLESGQQGVALDLVPLYIAPPPIGPAKKQPAVSGQSSDQAQSDN